MSLRKFIGLVGLLLLASGAWLMIFSKVTVTDGMGYTATCGTALGAEIDRDYHDRVSREQLGATLDQVTGAATHATQELVLRRLQGQVVSNPPECADAINTRRMIAIPIAVVGGIALLGSIAVRTRSAG